MIWNWRSRLATYVAKSGALLLALDELGGVCAGCGQMTFSSLRRDFFSLNKEPTEAEQALGQETTEANYSWLQDVKARLAALDGTEALIEGFGASSGRPVRSL